LRPQLPGRLTQRGAALGAGGSAPLRTG